MLNVQQEKFIQNIVKGMSQRQAYKDAYGASYDDNAIDINASKLFNDAKVQLRYKELMDKLEDKAIMSAKERMKWLSDVVNNAQFEEDDDGFKPADLNTKMKAIDILNKMTGEYIDKLKISNDEDKPFEVNINVVK